MGLTNLCTSCFGNQSAHIIPSETTTAMAPLTIRNLTITPIELTHIDLFEFPAQVSGGSLARLNTTVSGLFKGNNTSNSAVLTTTTPPTTSVTRGGLTVGKDQAPAETHDLKDLHALPFTTLETSLSAPDPTHQVLRLTLRTTPKSPLRPALYQIDIPTSTTRSLELSPLPSPSNIPTNPPSTQSSTQSSTTIQIPTQSFTAIYIPHSSTLAIFSSTSLSTWMTNLHPSLPLSLLSLPGTHNSPTYHLALPSVRCQARSLADQLANGVRFLDIRVSVSSNPLETELVLVHSAFPISLTGNKYFARDLLDVCYAFLDENPGEALVMSVKREGTGKGTDEILSKHLFDTYCAGTAAKRWFTEPRIPLLGEVRGKILLVRRHRLDASLRSQNGGKGWGIDASAWPDNCADGEVGTSNLIRVQDFYEVGQSKNILKKIGLAEAQLERTCEQVYTAPQIRPTEQSQQVAPPDLTIPPFYVNFLSASNFFRPNCWPDRIAAKVNPAMIEYLCVHHGDERGRKLEVGAGEAGTGVVVTDWVGLGDDWDLIRCIVGWNARLQLEK